MTFQQKYKIPHVSKSFGDWTVVDDKLQIIKNGDKSYAKGVTVQCKHGVKRVLTLTSLYKGKTKGCDACGGERSSKRKFSGVGELSRGYFNKTKSSAKTRHLAFSMTMSQLWSLYLKQNRRCALSGVEISLKKNYAAVHGSRAQTASIDRIDSSKGYTKENVQWVHKHINKLKNDVNQEEFVALCASVVDYNKKHQKRT